MFFSYSRAESRRSGGTQGLLISGNVAKMVIRRFLKLCGFCMFKYASVDPHNTVQKNWKAFAVFLMHNYHNDPCAIFKFTWNTKKIMSDKVILCISDTYDISLYIYQRRGCTRIGDSVFFCRQFFF